MYAHTYVHMHSQTLTCTHYKRVQICAYPHIENLEVGTPAAKQHCQSVPASELSTSTTSDHERWPASRACLRHGLAGRWFPPVDDVAFCLIGDGAGSSRAFSER